MKIEERAVAFEGCSCSDVPKGNGNRNYLIYTTIHVSHKVKILKKVTINFRFAGVPLYATRSFGHLRNNRVLNERRVCSVGTLIRRKQACIYLRLFCWYGTLVLLLNGD